jgi:hypothetical protein
MTRVTLGRSRVREIRPPGSVRAKAEWLSYSTTTMPMVGLLEPSVSTVGGPFDIRGGIQTVHLCSAIC